MPSTTPDLRTVTGGCSSFRAGGGERSGPGAAAPASGDGDCGPAWWWLNKKPPPPGAGPPSAALRAATGSSRGTPGPSRRAIFFSSRTTIHRPSMIIPVHAATAPVTIKVLPKLNSLTGIPKPIARRPANRKPIPAINHTTIIELTPGLRSKCSQAAYATILSYCAPRQPAIAGPVPVKQENPEFNSYPAVIRASEILACDDCCIASGKLRHNCQLLGKRTALYGCRGMRPKSAIAGPKGTPGYQ